MRARSCVSAIREGSRSISSSSRPHIPIAAATSQCSKTPLHPPSRQTSTSQSHQLSRHRSNQRRTYAIQSPGAPTFDVFNPQTKHLQKERAAKNPIQSRQVDYLRDEVAFRLCERLLDINRQFDRVLDLGANACNIAKILTRPPDDSTANIDGSERVETQKETTLASRIGTLVAAESSEALLLRDEGEGWFTDALETLNMETQILSPNTETLPYSPSTFDAVLSSLSLHWTNDLPTILQQINSILKPDSPFLGVMLGGDSLYELRTSLQLASQERLGGMKPHLSPLADVRDMGGLLQKASFNLLTVDVDDIVIDYPSIFALMTDLQAMGESNALISSEKAPIRRDVLAAADGIYRELHGNEDGSIPATFRLIYMIGWKGAPSQAKPLERGTGMFSIKDILEKQGGNVKVFDADKEGEGGGEDGKGGKL